MVNYWQSSTGLPLTDTNHKSPAINYRTCTGDEEQNTPSYVPTYVHGLSQAKTAPSHKHTHTHLNGHINMPEIERTKRAIVLLFWSRCTLTEKLRALRAGEI